MNYIQLGHIDFILFWLGCWVAFALSLRNHDNRLLPCIYGSLIASLFIVTHFIMVRPGEISAAQKLGPVWYLLQAGFSLFISYCAYQLKEAQASRIVSYASLASALLCLVFFVPASLFVWFGIGYRLPGILFYAGQNMLESLQVGAMIILSGPVVPVVLKAWHAIKQWRPPWTLRLPHRA